MRKAFERALSFFIERKDCTATLKIEAIHLDLDVLHLESFSYLQSGNMFSLRLM